MGEYVLHMTLLDIMLVTVYRKLFAFARNNVIVDWHGWHVRLGTCVTERVPPHTLQGMPMAGPHVIRMLM